MGPEVFVRPVCECQRLRVIAVEEQRGALHAVGHGDGERLLDRRRQCFDRFGRRQGALQVAPPMEEDDKPHLRPELPLPVVERFCKHDRSIQSFAREPGHAGGEHHRQAKRRLEDHLVTTAELRRLEGIDRPSRPTRAFRQQSIFQPYRYGAGGEVHTGPRVGR